MDPREGHVDFPKSRIKCQGVPLKDTVAGLKLENRNEALLDIVRCVFVSKKHAFWCASRTRGVDDVAEAAVDSACG